MTYKEVLTVEGHNVPGHVRLVDSMGNDLSVVRAARVSYDADWRAGEDEGKDAKLINYLLKNKHTTPFEMVQFKFEIKAPIFVFRQWHRHRTWSFNEMSGRYVELDEGFYVPEVGMYGVQNVANKQQRDITDTKRMPFDTEQTERDIKWRQEQVAQNRMALGLYRAHVHEGMPRELARSILPVATYSRMQASVDLHNLFHFLKLRCHSHAQYEIKVYADAILELIEPMVPVSVAAFRTHVLGGQ